jgi:hypothetical protein
MEPASQSLKERKLCAIADWIAGRICPEVELQAHDRTPGTQFSHRNTVEVAVLETYELLMRRTRGRSNVPKAQARTHPRHSMLLTGAPEGLPSASASSIGWSLSRSHRADHRRRPFAGHLSDGRSPRRTNWRTAVWRCAQPTRPAASCSASRTSRRVRSSDVALAPHPIVAWSASRTRREPREPMAVIHR